MGYSESMSTILTRCAQFSLTQSIRIVSAATKHGEAITQRFDKEDCRASTHSEAEIAQNRRS
ncbi:MAG: hypothetical protein QW514_05605 [Thermoprotei archaeon]